MATPDELTRTIRAAAGLALMLAAAPALADEPPASPRGGRMFGSEDDPRTDMRPARSPVVMRLDYIRAPGTETCPDEQGFRDAVGIHVRRWAPFAPNGPWRLVVIVSRSSDGYVGSAELRDVTGNLELKRAYPSTQNCVDLIGDLARSIGLKVDPPAPPSSHAPEPSRALEPSRSSEPAPLSDRPPLAKPLGLRLGVGTWMDLATAPRPAFGLSLDVGVRIAWFSIAAEGRFDPPAGGVAMDGVSVSTTRILGALVPCGHVGWFAGCLLGELGQIRGSIDVPGTTPDHQASLYLAAGTRLAVEIPVARHLLVRLAADLAGARPTVFRLNGQRIWESASFTGGIGAGALAAF